MRTEEKHIGALKDDLTPHELGKWPKKSVKCNKRRSKPGIELTRTMAQQRKQVQRHLRTF